ncbi:MAG: hypothetical protein LBG80_09330 [Bacteroidales bacterium]|jgi:hypothetical protein|nr:hypothetical protein [Bacteroidales bacterium]
MKGFEIKFGNNTLRIAEDEQMTISVMVEKIYGQLNFHCSGYIVNKNLHFSWYHGNLKSGDEIVIERKEIEETSMPIINSEGQYLTAEEPEENKLKNFSVLENYLKEKGLI